MNAPVLVDSSGWIEYFTDSPNAGFFAPAIEDRENLLVASLNVMEVFKWILREYGDNAALQAAAVMQQGTLVDLDVSLAIRAAKLGLERKLPLADSIVYATGQALGAVLWTQDAHFDGLQGVRYTRKLSSA